HDQTHVPLPADIARTSADLLFSEPPDLIVDDKTTQARLEEVLSDHLYATLTGAAEQAAALGGVYLRVTWDTTVADSAFITAVPADEAWPEFAWGRLRAVTFWHVVAEDNTAVWRHRDRPRPTRPAAGPARHRPTRARGRRRRVRDRRPHPGPGGRVRAEHGPDHGARVAEGPRRPRLGHVRLRRPRAAVRRPRRDPL